MCVVWEILVVLILVPCFSATSTVHNMYSDFNPEFPLSNNKNPNCHTGNSQPPSLPVSHSQNPFLFNITQNSVETLPLSEVMKNPYVQSVYDSWKEILKSNLRIAQIGQLGVV